MDTTNHRRRSLARRTFLSGVASSAATVILAACGGGTVTNTPIPATTAPSASSAAAPALVPAGANSVTIASFAFAPQSLTVAPGQTVTWTNKDTATHTVTEDKSTWDSKNLAVGVILPAEVRSAGYVHVPLQHPLLDERYRGRESVSAGNTRGRSHGSPDGAASTQPGVSARPRLVMTAGVRIAVGGVLVDCVCMLG